MAGRGVILTFSFSLIFVAATGKLLCSPALFSLVGFGIHLRIHDGTFVFW
jgi:hypothetical protein